jgi:hypothetical protein
MSLKLKCGFLTALTLAASMAWADTLELKNGSLIKGKFLGGTETEISFQVGSTVQKYNVADIVSLKFDSEGAASAPAPEFASRRLSPAAQSSLPDESGTGSACRNEAGLCNYPSRDTNFCAHHRCHRFHQ